MEKNQAVITSKVMGSQEYKFNLSVDGKLPSTMQEEIINATALAIAAVLSNSVYVLTPYGGYALTPERVQQ